MADVQNDPQVALAAVEASRLGQAQKKALRLVTEGKSYREAANAAGLRSTGSVRRQAAALRAYRGAQARSRGSRGAGAGDEDGRGDWRAP